MFVWVVLNSLSFFFNLIFFCDSVFLLCISGCPGTGYVEQTGLTPNKIHLLLPLECLVEGTERSGAEVLTLGQLVRKNERDNRK